MEALGESPVYPHGESLLSASSKKPGSLQILLSLIDVTTGCSRCHVTCASLKLCYDLGTLPKRGVGPGEGGGGAEPGNLHVNCMRNAFIYCSLLSPLGLEGLALDKHSGNTVWMSRANGCCLLWKPCKPFPKMVFFWQ